MPRLRIAALLLLTALALPLSAQQASLPIEQEMTPEQFRTAGLHKLSAAELAHLNAWLGRKLGDETAKAATAARARVVEENRGFFHFGKDEPIVSRIAGEFRGFDKGRTYTLENGQVWKQIEPASLVGVRLNSPAVTIKPSIIGNAWYLQIEGYNTTAKVQRIK
jgi:hypothetical protein